MGIVSLKAGKLVGAMYIPTYASEYITPSISAPSTARESGLSKVDGEISKVESDSVYVQRTPPE
jgi:hypothetical protein